MARSLNPAGVALIQSFESCRLTAYPDPGTGGAPWTIGWGHTGAEVCPGLIWTRTQADAAFFYDAMHECDAVEVLAPVSTDNQFAALVSFAYNEGPRKLAVSTLLRLHNTGDHAGAQTVK
jgi:lysozyme